MNKKTKQWDFYIAGYKFHNGDEVIDKLKVGDTLVLDPEFDNKYDSNAIQILFPDINSLNLCILGYIPKEINKEIIQLMCETDGSALCTITEVNPDAKPWNRVKVNVKEEE